MEKPVQVSVSATSLNAVSASGCEPFSALGAADAQQETVVSNI